MKEINGFKYSLKKFENYKFRVLFVYDLEEDNYQNNLTIYTDNDSKDEVSKLVKKALTKKFESTYTIIKIYWFTEEQDERTALFIDELLNNDCTCENPTLGTFISKCGTCNKWFKKIN